MTRDAELEALAELARTTAIGAGELLIEYSSRREELRAGAQAKTSVTDLASEADLASERYICEALRAKRPADAIICEEGSPISGTSGLSWIVDPLDGTINFLYGFSPYVVSIALYHGEQGLLGVVHEPQRNETFLAIAGKGAFYNGKRIVAPERNLELGQALIGTGFGYGAAMRERQGELVAHLLPRVRDIRRAGAAAYDICSVAIGRLDGYYEAGLKDWDKAAGLVIASEAGIEAVELEDLIPGEVTVAIGRRALLEVLVEVLRDAAGRR